MDFNLKGVIKDLVLVNSFPPTYLDTLPTGSRHTWGEVWPVHGEHLGAADGCSLYCHIHTYFYRGSCLIRRYNHIKFSIIGLSAVLLYFAPVQSQSRVVAAVRMTC